MLTALKTRFRIWLFRPKIESGIITLTQRRIFILPTRQGLALGLVLILMLLGDINYNLSLGYVLTFLLAMMAVMSMLHAFRNLAHLEIRARRAEAVFSGETAHFIFHFRNPGTLDRYQLSLRHDNGSTISFDVPARQDSDVAFPVPATQRGWLKPGQLTLFTEFPLGLFHAWSYLHFDTRCLVYPKPRRCRRATHRTARASAASPEMMISADCANMRQATRCRASHGKPTRADRVCRSSSFPRWSAKNCGWTLPMRPTATTRTNCHA